MSYFGRCAMRAEALPPTRDDSMTLFGLAQ
jgi:hypothetical protein